MGETSVVSENVNIRNFKKKAQRCRLTSANGVLSLLEEDAPDVLSFALDRLDKIVDEFWHEIADFVSRLEVLYEDEQFPFRKKAALLVSKVYFHLGSYDDSLAFALGAGQLFNESQPSEYYDMIISKSLDQYIKLRQKMHTNSSPSESTGMVKTLSVKVDQRLEDIVEAMFQRCFDAKQYKQLIGLALECRRLDVFEKAITQSTDVDDSISYAFKITLKLFNNYAYRAQILAILSRLYKNSKTPNLIKMTQCLIFLNDDATIHEMLVLFLRTKGQCLMAYQIGFDLYQGASQQFLFRLINRLTASAPLPELMKRTKELPRPEKTPVEGPPQTSSQVKIPPALKASNTNVSKASSDAGLSKRQSPVKKSMQSNSKLDIGKPTSPDLEVKQKLDTLKDSDRALQERFMKMGAILSGDIPIELDLQFLIRNNKTDKLILKTTKEYVKNSICHSATVIANGLMNCGTTNDQFLRDNLEWLAKSVNWARFTATASLGVIHKRHERDSLRLIASYLPKDSTSAAHYVEGGALYALGLLHANHGERVLSYLLEQLANAQTEPVKHGACLAIGLAALGTQNKEIYEKLKVVLYEDDAVIGEAASISMGLVMLGSGDTTVIKEMMTYSKESLHEKIQRGISIGVGLVVFNILEGADWLIENLVKDVDPLMRRSGMNAIAMAYCGTGSNDAIRQLLNVAVSDVHDDVRRAAVEAIGFVMFRQPGQCPGVVSPLLDSYNPHVRYGAAFALGVACCGTGSSDALDLLLPMIKDTTPFVRQAALIASALISVQHNANTCPRSRDFRMIYQRVIQDRNQQVMVKFGAILAQGIIDAGGRNCTISLQSRTGHTNAEAVVGMFVFAHFWYWFPLAHFISLTFTPTSLVALNSELKMPKLEFKSQAKPSLFAYPPIKEEKKDKEREKIASAVLSISYHKKEDENSKKGLSRKSKSRRGKSSKTSKNSKTSVAEPEFEMISNPARVMPLQLQFISMPEKSRYKPIKELNIGGVIMVTDSRPDNPIDIVNTVKSSNNSKVDEDKEPGPPEPFEYIE